MTLHWNDRARQEFLEAVAYYAQIDSELGERFITALEGAVTKLRTSPRMARKFDGEARKVRLERFPFAVIYQEENDGQRIHIIAVMHLHREPGYWRGRKS